MTYDIRAMTAEDVRRAVGWAAAEGWNPGTHDAEIFRSVDPDGFIGGWMDDRMIASISVVNYGPDFAFLGFYIVQPEFRSQGFGFQLWNAALEHAGPRVVGLDGVVAEQENYKRSGFDLAWRNIRFGGVARWPKARTDVEVRRISHCDEDILSLDRNVFPCARAAFWDQWFRTDVHIAFKATLDGDPVGFVTLRACETGFKIGPLVAKDEATAQGLLAALAPYVPSEAEVFLDVPEPNVQAVALALNLGLSPVFETARMYRGPAPDVDLSMLFGVTSFELG